MIYKYILKRLNPTYREKQIKNKLLGFFVLFFPSTPMTLNFGNRQCWCKSKKQVSYPLLVGTMSGKNLEIYIKLNEIFWPASAPSPCADLVLSTHSYTNASLLASGNILKHSPRSKNQPGKQWNESGYNHTIKHRSDVKKSSIHEGIHKPT